MTERMRCPITAQAALLCAVLAIMAPLAKAAGYAVGQESISGAGVAHAGGAAAAQDSSTVFSNPAGMTALERSELSFGAHAIVPRVDYDDRGSVLFDGVTPISGSDGGDGGQSALVPNGYVVWKKPGGMAVGLGVNAPYGLVTRYDQSWKGRYNEITTGLKTFNLNPSFAMRISDSVSLGLGLNAQMVQAKLLQAIDFGSSCVSALGAGACAGFGLAAQSGDGRGTVRGSDWGFGYNLGVLFEPVEGTRFGAHYRSQVVYRIDMNADFTVPASARAFLTAAGTPNAFTNSRASTQLTIPETLSLSAYHEVSPSWAVMGDVTWTRWSQFEQLRIEFSEPTTPANVLQTRWDDVLRVSLGTTWRWDDRLTLRGGVAFDESPIDDTFRGPGVPDSDRISLGLGFGYQVSDSLSIDVAYQHLFFKKSSTRRPSATNSVLIGELDVDVDVASIGVRWTF